MSKEMGPYDTSLQMFVEKPHELDVNKLKFYRWLAEQNRLEHPIAGPSYGAVVTNPQIEETAILASVRAELDAIPNGENQSITILPPKGDIVDGDKQAWGDAA